MVRWNGLFGREYLQNLEAVLNKFDRITIECRTIIVIVLRCFESQKFHVMLTQLYFIALHLTKVVRSRNLKDARWYRIFFRLCTCILKILTTRAWITTIWFALHVKYNLRSMNDFQTSFRYLCICWIFSCCKWWFIYVQIRAVTLCSVTGRICWQTRMRCSRWRYVATPLAAWHDFW